MKRWIDYLKERFPFGNYIIVSALLAGAALTTTVSESWNYEHTQTLLLVTIGLFLLFVQIRAMDEIKDFDTDSQAHPERPLPRGLLQLAEVKRFVQILNVVLVVYALLLFGWLSTTTALIMFALIAFVNLMYKEFFVGEWLSDHPILYAVSHQATLFLMAFFAISALEPHNAFSGSAWAVGAVFIGAFLTYEIGRKLDPEAHPALKTYLRHCGFNITLLFILCAQISALIGSTILGFPWIALVGMPAVVLGMLYIKKKPAAFKRIEHLTSFIFLAEVAALMLS